MKKNIGEGNKRAWGRKRRKKEKRGKTKNDSKKKETIESVIREKGRIRNEWRGQSRRERHNRRSRVTALWLVLISSLSELAWLTGCRTS